MTNRLSLADWKFTPSRVRPGGLLKKAEPSMAVRPEKSNVFWLAVAASKAARSVNVRRPARAGAVTSPPSATARAKTSLRGIATPSEGAGREAKVGRRHRRRRWPGTGRRPGTPGRRPGRCGRRSGRPRAGPLDALGREAQPLGLPGQAQQAAAGPVGAGQVAQLLQAEGPAVVQRHRGQGRGPAVALVGLPHAG